MREAVSKEPANCRLVPSTVTFLFTDIEGSTALWERDRFAIATVVERHLAWLHTSIAISGGVLFKTVGDAVQAAFATAPDAVVAALARQRALLAENWGALGELPVRMALHAGEAAPDEQGDYHASPLNRLARILGADHGSQALLSNGPVHPLTSSRAAGMISAIRSVPPCRFVETSPGYFFGSPIGLAPAPHFEETP